MTNEKEGEGIVVDTIPASQARKMVDEIAQLTRELDRSNKECMRLTAVLNDHRVESDESFDKIEKENVKLKARISELEAKADMEATGAKKEPDLWEGVYQEPCGSVAIKKIAHINTSADYDVSVAIVFELANGKYAYIEQSGCSCWVPNKDEVLFVGSFSSAMARFEVYLSDHCVPPDKRHEILSGVDYRRALN